MLGAGLLVPATSSAKVTVLSDAEPVVTFTTAKCKKASKKGALLKFIATARRNGWKLSVNVFASGLSHSLQYGGDGPADFTLTSPGGTRFSNLNRPPDAPPGGGAIEFPNKKRKRFGIGFSPAFDEAISSSVSMAGGLKCIYPKKKKKRR